MDKIVAITFGLGGHTEHAKNSRLHGYDRPDDWKPRDGSDYTGCVVIDGREMFRNKPSLALTLPMVGDVPDGQPERFNDIMSPDERKGNMMLQAMKAEQGNMFGSLIAIADACPSYSGLDIVSPNDYAALVVQHGARVGDVVDGVIVWR